MALVTKQKGQCQVCGNKLRKRENDSSILLVCTNSACRNYWINEGSEIIMFLK